MVVRADGVRRAYPLFQAEGGGSQPTSALQLFFRAIDLDKAVALNALWHSRTADFGGGGCRVAHAAECEGTFYATAIWTNPSSPKLPQLTWLMLKRWAIADDAPRNTGSRMMKWMLRDVRRRFQEVETLVTYSDPDEHSGTIYKVCGWVSDGITIRKGTQWRNRNRAHTGNKGFHRVERWRYEMTG